MMYTYRKLNCSSRFKTGKNKPCPPLRHLTFERCAFFLAQEYSLVREGLSFPLPTSFGYGQHLCGSESIRV